jgi:hypothetical protein
LNDPDLDSAEDGDTKICNGTGGYSDIYGGIRIGDSVVGGSQVTLRDESGKVLATTSLETKLIFSESCDFEFTLSNVPDADFYQLEVSHRGGLTFSKQELESRSWDVRVTLGD